MVTKEELSDELNQLLGIDDWIDFSGMTKESLERFKTWVTDNLTPQNMIKTGVERMRTNFRGQILDRPIKDFLDPALLEEGKPQPDTGLLGFGLLKTRPIINVKKTLESRRTSEDKT